MTNDLQHIGGAWECESDSTEMDEQSMRLDDYFAEPGILWKFAVRDWLTYHDTLAYAERGREPS